MNSRAMAAAAALTFALSTVAQALPTLTAPALALRASIPGNATPTAWVDPPRAAAPARQGAAAPVETPSQAAVPVEPSATASAGPSLAPVPAKRAEAAPSRIAPTPPRLAPAPPARKPATIRTARYAGGEGASWKTGRNAYAFSGSYGGCRFTGHAGPRGFTIDRAC